MHPTQKPPAPAEDVDLTPADVLRGAALYLQRHGWTQGRYYDLRSDAETLTPPACAAGAIGMAAFGEVVDDPHAACGRTGWADYTNAEEAATGYLDLILIDHQCSQDSDCPGLHEWNDATGRTADEVITTLRDAADEWDRLHASGGVS